MAPVVGRRAPDSVLGVHVNALVTFPSGDPAELADLTEAEQQRMARMKHFQDEMMGYSHIQATRPQTLAYGLTDSPAGQLAWNSELFMGFGGENVDNVDRDRFLTHVTIFWVTATAGSSARQYYEDARTGAGYREVPNDTPTGVSVFPNDFRSVRAFAERSNNIVHWSTFDRGGHFAASDAPDLLIRDLREFFRRFR